MLTKPLPSMRYMELFHTPWDLVKTLKKLRKEKEVRAASINLLKATYSKETHLGLRPNPLLNPIQKLDTEKCRNVVFY